MTEQRDRVDKYTEVTDTQIETTNLWLAAALHSGKTKLINMTKTGEYPYFSRYTFHKTLASSKIMEKFMAQQLRGNLYDFYQSYQYLKGLSMSKQYGKMG